MTVRKVILNFSIAVMALILLWYFRHEINPKGGMQYFVFAYSIVLAIQLIATLLRRRIFEICFDGNAKVLCVTEKNLISGAKSSRFSLDNVMIEIDRHKPLIGSENVGLYFIKGKIELFAVNSRKDGFTTESLLRVAEMANKLSITVRKY